MPGNGKHTDRHPEYIDRFTPAQMLAGPCDRLVGRCKHRAGPVRGKFRHPALVIGMVVCHENARQLQLRRRQMGLHRRRFSGIDNKGFLAALQHPDVVVFESRNVRDLKHAGTIPSRLRLVK
jgi:hypothetical protein